ncbi:MAG: c-type cytochrome [Longimicrobiales bacterium]
MGRRLWTAAVALSLMVFIAACGGEPSTDQVPADTTTAAPPPPPPTDTGGAAALPPGVTPEMVAAGQAIFTGAGGCVACHGPDATGTPLAPNLTDATWLNVSGRNYDEIVALIKTGVATPKEAPAPMPPKGGSQITDQQVNEVAAYVVSISR